MISKTCPKNQTNMNCLIVDDEKLAQDILEGYIEKTPGLRLSGRCNNALEAISALHTGNIDLMFLDIKMPEITGADLLKLLKNPPAVIMTTAFSEYALDGYEWNILDYLLKPIPYEHFLKAVYNVEARMQPPMPSPEEHQNEEIFVKSDGRLVRVLPLGNPVYRRPEKLPDHPYFSRKNNYPQYVYQYRRIPRTLQHIYPYP